MQVLMFVSTMLMIMVLLTYARLDSFRGFGLVQAAFTTYMEKHERDYINKRALEQYIKTVASQGTSGQNQDQSEARALLNFNFFVNKELRDKHSKEFQDTYEITKNFIHYLYGNQSFYEEIEAKRPNFVAEILQAIMDATDQLTDKNKIKKICEIGNIDLRNNDLNEVFTYMLKGSEGKYYSLLDLITLSKGNYKIRVYLAPKPLLMALFGSQSIVDEIIQTRNSLYSQARKNVDLKELSKQFSDQFLNQRLPYVSPDILDFGVSKTNPKVYK